MRYFALPIVLAVATMLPPTGAAERLLVLDPPRTRVGFLLDATAHDVEGEFALRSGEIRFDPETGAASGEIQVDLTSARTGNKKRDKTMHERVLETARFPRAVFRPRRLDGALAPEGTSEIVLEGVLAFHGAEHEWKLPARVTRTGSRTVVDARFTIPFVEWGLHDPSFLFLRVSKTVAVHVTAEGEFR